MQRSNGEPLAAFSINVSILNEGTAPLEVIDLLLVAKTQDGAIFYEPIVLWDLQEWIAAGNAPDKVGRTQKGQVPLPVLISADDFFDFGCSALFLPVDETTTVEPRNHDEATLELYALTDRNSEYQKIDEHVMDKDDLKAVINKAFSGAISTRSRSERDRIVNKLTAKENDA
jgi:hypothetical protein